MSTFLDARGFRALGEKPKLCEHFKGVKTQSFDQLIPSMPEYQSMVPPLRDHQIQNKTAVTFKFYDAPGILEVNN